MGYAEPVKGKNTLLWIILGLAGFWILLCALGGFFGFRFFQGVAGKAVNMVACGVDLQAARAAIKKYAEAHDGKLPPAGAWQDSVKQYFKAERDKPMTVIATGGVASLFHGATTAIDHFDPDLTIRGLLEIHRRNTAART